MQISSRFTIAIHIFTCVEYFKDREKITSDFLSGSINSNPVSIRNILSQLRKAGLITVARGTGGIKITRDLADILEIEASLLYDDFSRFLAVPYTEALKRVRMVLGLSLKAFAEQIEIAPGYYYKLEGGNRRPSRKIYQKICAMLEATGLQTSLLWEHPLQ